MAKERTEPIRQSEEGTLKEIVLDITARRLGPKDKVAVEDTDRLISADVSSDSKYLVTVVNISDNKPENEYALSNLYKTMKSLIESGQGRLAPEEVRLIFRFNSYEKPAEKK